MFCSDGICDQLWSNVVGVCSTDDVLSRHYRVYAAVVGGGPVIRWGAGNDSDSSIRYRFIAGICDYGRGYDRGGAGQVFACSEADDRAGKGQPFVHCCSISGKCIVDVGVRSERYFSEGKSGECLVEDAGMVPANSDSWAVSN